jgi:cobalt-zinc-cadmium efflux system membrane fusion protein
MLIIGVSCLVLLYRGVLRWDSAHGSTVSDDELDKLATVAGLIELSHQQPDTIRFSDRGLTTVGIETAEVKAAPPPEPLKLPGSILLDPNRLVRIHSRFPGELVALGQIAAAKPGTQPRQLYFGDYVKKGQLLAVVWSKDIGEKKSELVDALSKAAFDKTLLTRLESVPKGTVPEPRLKEARRNYEADLIAVEKAKRTLQAWRLTDEELQEIQQEAERIQNREAADAKNDRAWAEAEVRSPIDGIIVEKNFSVGDLIDVSQDLFKIADLSRVQVLANAYEEDLPRLRALRPEQRHWEIDVKQDPHDVPVSGTFNTIGRIIDPTQHSGAVMGWVDNLDGRFKIGQFITATIDLPADPSLVVVPTSALIEDGVATQVWVETDKERHEFSCRKVAVVERGRKQTYVRSEPRPAEKQNGAEALLAGEHVIRTGVLELLEELRGLQAAVRER